MSFEREEIRQLRRTTQFSDVLSSNVYVYRLDCNYSNLNDTLRKVVEDAVLESEAEGEDWIQVIVDSDGFKTPVIINQYYEKQKDFNYDGLALQLERVDQSNSGNALSKGLKVSVYRLRRPYGNGKKRSSDCAITTSKRIRRPGWRTVSIEDDNNCLLSCIVYRIREIDEQNKRYIRDGQQYSGHCKSWAKANRERDSRVASMKQKCGLTRASSYGPNEWNVLSQHLNEIGPFRLIIYDVNGSPLFITPFQSDDVPEVCLLLFDKHYYITRTIHFGKKHYCIYCRESYESTHLCAISCEFCKHSECLQSPVDDQQCEKCRKLFRNQICLKNHVDNSQCTEVPRCELCQRILKSGKHECRFFTCKTCHKKVEPGHECFMATLNLTKMQARDQKRRVYAFYDFETAAVEMERTPANPDPKAGVKLHVPILAILRIVCSLCWTMDKADPGEGCDFCHQQKLIFKGDKSSDNMVEFIFTDLRNSLPAKTEMIFFGHNAQKFDVHFILDSIVSKNMKLPSTILRKGNAIFELGFEKIRFLDSLRFIPMPLRKFPAAWGIPELVKGYFPHRITTRDIFESPVMTTIPDMSSFYADEMKQEEYNKFLQWYEAVDKSVPYDLASEIVKYCDDDVRILMFGVMRFRALWHKSYGIDPFVRNSTLPAAVIEAFRSTGLTEDTVPVTPYHTYGKAGKSSCEESAVLDWLEQERGVIIQRQVNLGNVFYFDGMYETLDGKKIIIEYNNCFWHCCSECYPDLQPADGPRNISANAADVPEQRTIIHSMFHTKQRDLRKQKLIESMPDYHLEVIWSHDIPTKEGAEDFIRERRKQYFSRRSIPTIDHRSVLSGGRTETFRTFFECGPHDVVSYYDVNGLYPSVLLKERYPICHPQHFFEFPLLENDDETSLNKFFLSKSYFGIIDAVVKPPDSLIHPVLHTKVNGKLMFVLCEVCAEQQFCGSCPHKAERVIRGVWFTGTMEYAITKGYRIIRIRCVEHYASTSASLANPFHKFINEGMIRKKEAEGDAERGIEPNPSMRTLMKLIINAFWGKLANNVENEEVQMIRTKAELYRIFGDPKKNVKDVLDLGSALRIVYETENCFTHTPSYSSLITAILVTAYARLTLRKFMDMIPEEDLFYVDTDSLIFRHDKGTDPSLQNIGKECGQIASELLPGSYIQKFASMGPKSYFCEIQSGDGSTSTIAKLKGITLTRRAVHDQLHISRDLEEMFGFVKTNYAANVSEKQPLFAEQNCIRANSRNQITMYKSMKKIGNDFDKRRLIDDFKTLPWGFISR